jgi:hypothetical protein
MLFAVKANWSTLTRTSPSVVWQRDKLVFVRFTSARSTRKSVVSTCMTRVFHNSAARTLTRIDCKLEVDAGSELAAPSYQTRFRAWRPSPIIVLDVANRGYGRGSSKRKRASRSMRSCIFLNKNFSIAGTEEEWS